MRSACTHPLRRRSNVRKIAPTRKRSIPSRRSAGARSAFLFAPFQAGRALPGRVHGPGRIPARAGAFEIDHLSRGWTQKNATVALVLVNSVASGLEFEDAADVKRALGALDAAPEALYAVARRPDSTGASGWHPERAPATALPANGSVATQFAAGMLRVVAPVRGKSGVSGFLEAG